MLSYKYKKAVMDWLDPWVLKCTRGKVNPNYITLLGLFWALGAGFYYAGGKLALGGLWLGLAGLCDLLDGSLARAAGRITPFGAFWDSTLDRYADMVVLLGLAWYYAGKGEIYTLLAAFLALVGSVMVSYTRARAENLIAACKVGWFERPERIILLLIGSFFPLMPWMLWALALGANVTAGHRIYHTYKRTKVEY
jgi:CDP-diacylglycerol--glycerol-3-phosphate 3-phosphatidyltransferase